MNQPSQGVVTAVCAAVALLSLWNVLDFFRVTEDQAGQNADVYQVGQQAARFQAIASSLPPAGVIGYVSDQTTGATLGTVMYDGAQYALAPRLLTDRLERADSPWVVGNFSKPVNFSEFARRHSIAVVRDFGSGVVLFRKDHAQ